MLGTRSTLVVFIGLHEKRRSTSGRRFFSLYRRVHAVAVPEPVARRAVIGSKPALEQLHRSTYCPSREESKGSPGPCS